MKKTIIISSLLLVACTAIISCKKTSSNNSIVGNWLLTGGTIVTTDSTTTPHTVTTKDTTLVHGTDLVQFNADNTYSEYNLTIPATLSSSGSYVILRDTVSIFPTSSPTSISYPYSVSGNTLTISLNQSSPGMYIHTAEKFTRQ